MTQHDEANGLHSLLDDVIDSDLPDPELLARYAMAPNELRPEERALVERALQQSRAVVDELDTLRGFDFRQLDADRRELGGLARVRAWIVSFVGQPAVWASVAAAAALVLWLAQSGSPRREGAGPNLGIEEVPPLVAEQLPPREEQVAAQMPSEHVPAEAPALSPETSGAHEERGEHYAQAPELPEKTDETLGVGKEERSHEVSEAKSEETASAADPSEAPVEREVLLAMLTPEYHAPSDALGRNHGETVIRGRSDPSVGIRTLAPGHVARTVLAQPTLAWSIDRIPESGAFYLSIIAEGDDPLVESLRLSAPRSSGIQATSLAEIGIELKPQVEYRWSISQRSDADSPPTSYSFGWIERVEPDDALKEQLAALPLGSRPDALARAGIWYDALELLIDLSSRFPGDERPKAALRALLDQAGLDGSAGDS